MTPYMAIYFCLGPECILNPFSMSNPVGNFIMARKVYRGFMVSIFHREKLANLIE